MNNSMLMEKLAVRIMRHIRKTDIQCMTDCVHRDDGLAGFSCGMQRAIIEDGKCAFFVPRVVPE